MSLAKYIKITSIKFLMKNYILFSCFFLATNNFALGTNEISQILKNSTVRINLWENYNTTNQELHAGGSGIVLNKHKETYFILTNAHVLLSQFCLLDSVDEKCEDLLYDDSITLTVDTTDSSFEYPVTNEDFIYWEDVDLAVIAIDGAMYEEMDDLKTIEIGGMWHPLQSVYSAGFPLIIGNYKNYRDIFYDTCVINAGIFDAAGMEELLGYSMVHDCNVAGGMSGGPLVTQDGKLMGINGLAGDAILEQGWLGDIISSDFDNLKYAYAIHINDLYGSVLSSDYAGFPTGNFNPESKFYNFLPHLSRKENLQLYDLFDDAYEDKELLNKVFK
jgi:hypothetical protein|tara:strand:- start:246 stop:1241 length:996 start_codon:yes stop_codon:yes gene_type:complete